MTTRQPDRVRCEDCGADMEIPGTLLFDDPGDVVWCCKACGAELEVPGMVENEADARATALERSVDQPHA